MRILSVFCLGLFSVSLWGEEPKIRVFESGERQVELLELYTSQGCSSCPRADAWLSDLLDEDFLWREVVPVAFHVDYWDRLGWRDAYASRAFTERQYAYRKQGRIKSVYTPGFVSNGREWRGYFEGKSLELDGGIAGNLRVEVDQTDGKARGVFEGEGSGRYVLNVAVLGFGIETRPSRGENSGRGLEEDFVVLGFAESERVDVGEVMEVVLPEFDRGGAERLGVAAWVSRAGGVAPVQATGGWLGNE